MQLDRCLEAGAATGFGTLVSLEACVKHGRAGSGYGIRRLGIWGTHALLNSLQAPHQSQYRVLYTVAAMQCPGGDETKSVKPASHE